MNELFFAESKAPSNYSAHSGLEAVTTRKISMAF